MLIFLRRRIVSSSFCVALAVVVAGCVEGPGCAWWVEALGACTVVLAVLVACVLGPGTTEPAEPADEVT